MFFLALAQVFVFGHMVIPHHNHDLELDVVENTEAQSNDCHHHESCISPCTVEQDSHQHYAVVVNDCACIFDTEFAISVPAVLKAEISCRNYYIVTGFEDPGVPLRAPPFVC